MNLVQIKILQIMPLFKPPALQEARVLDGTGRSSRVGWMDREYYAHVFSFCQGLVDDINKLYRYDIWDLCQLQYAEYKQGDYYFPHIDNSLQSNAASNRKLSFSIILNPAEFTGGELQFLQNPGLGDTPIDPYVVFFPSFVMHGVAPVKTGVRKSLVGWLEGPPFK